MRFVLGIAGMVSSRQRSTTGYSLPSRISSRLAAASLALLFNPAEQPAADGAKKPAFSLTPEPPPGASRLLAELHSRLVDRGLLAGSWWNSSRPWIILAPALATLGLGVAKICVGISRGKPVGFLVFGCVALAAVSVFAAARKPRRTRQGDAILQETRTRFRDSGGQDAWRERREIEALPLAVAMLGPATLIGTGFSFANTALNEYRNRTQAGGFIDTSSGCGSGGDGGGGGD